MDAVPEHATIQWRRVQLRSFGQPLAPHRFFIALLAPSGRRSFPEFAKAVDFIRDRKLVVLCTLVFDFSELLHSSLEPRQCPDLGAIDFAKRCVWPPAFHEVTLDAAPEHATIHGRRVQLRSFRQPLAQHRVFLAPSGRRSCPEFAKAVDF